MYLKNVIYDNKLCVIQQQVPLLLPCVNFAQITIPSLTYQKATFLIKDILKKSGVDSLITGPVKFSMKSNLSLFFTPLRFNTLYSLW